MAINTLITLKDALTTFVEQHEQLQRIDFEADDHRAPKITDGDEFPMLFVAPLSVQMGNAMNMHTIRIYVYERINDDRSDVWENANDTSLMLRDIKVWWNSYSDSDIMITGEPSGEFKCDAELDNVVGYYSDFIFEIPSHGRCDVPINVVPDPSPSCADASYIVQYVDGTLIESGTIPSGGSRTIDVPLCEDATWELRNSEGTLLDSGTIASGGSATIVAPDATYEIRKSNNAMLYQGIVASGGSLVQNISDSMVRVRKSDNQVIQEVSVRAESIENYDVADSVITLQNSELTTISTTNVLATEAETITAPDATVDNSDATYSASVASNATLTLPDSQLNVNSVDVGDVVSVKTIDVNLTDGTDPVTPDAVSLVGNTLTIAVPSGGTIPVGATLMKTGQTTSYRTGDDGDLQAGRATDFFTLPSSNPFGNTNRFTDELGATTYANDIVIDWSTYNGSDVLGYKITEYSVTSWNQAIDDASATSIGSFTTGWRLTNVIELENICWWNSTSQLNHSSSGSTSPFVLGGTWEAWTSNTYIGITSQSITRTHIGTRLSRAKTGTAPTKAWACRTFTVTGTTLS